MGVSLMPALSLRADLFTAVSQPGKSFRLSLPLCKMEPVKSAHRVRWLYDSRETIHDCSGVGAGGGRVPRTSGEEKELREL